MSKKARHFLLVGIVSVSNTNPTQPRLWDVSPIHELSLAYSITPFGLLLTTILVKQSKVLPDFGGFPLSILTSIFIYQGELCVFHRRTIDSFGHLQEVRSWTRSSVSSVRAATLFIYRSLGNCFSFQLLDPFGSPISKS